MLIIFAQWASEGERQQEREVREKEGEGVGGRQTLRRVATAIYFRVRD